MGKGGLVSWDSKQAQGDKRDTWKCSSCVLESVKTQTKMAMQSKPSGFEVNNRLPESCLSRRKPVLKRSSLAQCLALT